MEVAEDRNTLTDEFNQGRYGRFEEAAPQLIILRGDTMLSDNNRQARQMMDVIDGIDQRLRVEGSTGLVNLLARLSRDRAIVAEYLTLIVLDADEIISLDGLDPGTIAGPTLGQGQLLTLLSPIAFVNYSQGEAHWQFGTDRAYSLHGSTMGAYEAELQLGHLFRNDHIA